MHLLHTNTRVPSANLNRFIESYVYRTISVKKNEELIKFMPCRHGNSIDFFIGDSYDTIDLKSGNIKPFLRCTIRGPRTYKKYKISIRGNFRSFSIRFTSTGLYQLLGIPMDKFCDEAVDALLVNPIIFRELTERLMDCHDIQSCIKWTEYYLLKQFKVQSPQVAIVSKLADMIIRSVGTVKLASFYNQLPYSSRQLERNFVNEIGVTPKLYESMIRFENMIKNKIKYPDRKWTEISYDYNYFDQMHLIKDFHKFLDITPRNFSPEDFAF